ncbi:MAG: AlkZ family DNA glycosylase [Planctomycetes bacterium]|nr:AlkZ family DNA glycosylase [Planctomycetota bacterium]
MSPRALNRATLSRQMLLAREKVTALEAIEQLVALQAQWPKPPFIGLWSRVHGFQAKDLAALLHRRTVVRATLLRGTLHLVSAKDYMSFRPAIQPVLTRGLQAILKERAKALRVDALTAAARRFFGAEPRTFTELRAFLMELEPEGDERAMGYAVRTHLPLVQVPTDDAWGFPADSDFALADAWIGKNILDGEVKPDTLVLRYLAAFGPASAADMQAWSGLQGLGPVFEALRPKMISVRDERGRELFDLPNAPRPTEDTPAPLRFLPEFDNLIVSRADARFVAKEHRPKVFLPGLRVRSTILVDGLVAAAWAVTRKKSAATLTIEPFAPLPKKTKDEIAAEGERLLQFVEPDASERQIAFAKVD